MLDELSQAVLARDEVVKYLRGGYGVRTPSRHDHSYYYGGYGPRAYYGPGPVGVAAGIAAGTAAAIAGAPYYDSYGYYEGPGY